MNVGSFLLTRFEETWRTLRDDVLALNDSLQTRQEIMISWKFPPQGWLALNTDGASRGNPGLAGGGGIIRDHSGVLQYAFSANFGSCTAFRAEIKALEIGLDLAIRMGVKKIIQLDNVAAVTAISNDEPYGGDCVHVIHSCRNMIKNNDWEVCIFHVYREGNRAAHWLANVGVKQTSIKFEMIQVPPLELGKILHEDLVGVAWPRMVPSS